MVLQGITKRKRRNLFLTTLVLSVVAVALELGAISTDKWFSGNVRLLSSNDTASLDYYYGLYRGHQTFRNATVSRNTPDSSYSTYSHDLYICCAPTYDACMLIFPDLRSQCEDEIIAWYDVGSALALDTMFPLWLWCAVLILFGLGGLFGIASCIVASLEAYDSIAAFLPYWFKKNCRTSRCNIIAGLSLLVFLCLAGYFQSFKIPLHDYLVMIEQEGTVLTTTSVEYPYWLVLGSTVCHLTNYIFVATSETKFVGLTSATEIDPDLESAFEIYN